MNIDRALISKAIQTGSIPTLISRGVAPYHFNTNSPDGKELAEVLEWISNYSKRYNAPPSMQIFRDRWPAFSFEPSSDPVEALVDAFFVNVKRRAYSAKVVELARAEQDPTRWADLDQIMLDAARDIAALVPSGRVARFSDMKKRIDQYEDEVANPELRSSWKMGIDPFDDITNGMSPGNLVTIAGFSGRGKALDLDTPVPTPSGWTTMGQIKKGDIVFGADGQLTRVSEAWPVLHDRVCYEVGFSDGSTIIADAEHKWLTYSGAARQSEANLAKRSERVAPWNDQRDKRVLPSVVTTQQIADDLADGLRKHSIPCAGPAQFPEADIPIDPYVFGYWLGDGTSVHADISVGREDLDELLLNLVKAGLAYTVHETPTKIKVHFGSLTTCQRGHTAPKDKSGCSECTRLRNRRRVYGDPLPPKTQFTAQTWLGRLGVIDDKHVPSIYMRSSVEQRLAMLQGIVDSDGHVQKCGRVEIAVTNQRLATDILALCRGLGLRATMTDRPAKLYGRVVGTSYRVSFTTDLQVARLSRKRERIQTKVGTRATHRYIDYIRPVDSRPVRCIAVEAKDHQFLVGESYIPTHNSLMSQFILMSTYNQEATGLLMSLEMTAPEIFERLDTMVVNFSHKLLSQRKLPEEQVALWRRLANQFAGAKNDIVVKDDLLGCTTDRVYAEISRYKPDIVVIDYVQLMRSRQSYASQWQGLVDITNDLKQIAIAANCVIVMVSQDGRSSADDGSGETNMGGSISVYQAADIYLGLHQTDEMYHDNVMEARLIKNRRGVRQQKANMLWNPSRMEFAYQPEPKSHSEKFLKAAA